jgi:ABC-type dipeptide/oligopeptide/nickel transport system permease subunit
MAELEKARTNAKTADLSNSEPRNWNEILRFGILGFFIGSVLWIAGLGIHQLLILAVNVGRSLSSAIAFGLPDAILSDESALSFEIWALDVQRAINDFLNGVVYWLDMSDLLLPLLIGLAFFLWRFRFKGRRGVWMTTAQALFRNRSAVIGIVVIGLFALVGNFSQLLQTHDPYKTLVGRPRTAPCTDSGMDAEGNPICAAGQFIMGTDSNGRDLYSRVVWGTRISIPIGLIAVTISIFFGVIIGLLSGYYGGWFDNIVMRFMDVLLAFPSLLLAIAIVTVLGPGLENALIAISIVNTPSYARLMRASVLSLKEQEFVLAERALGASHSRIMFNQILPNALTPIVVQGTLGVGTAVLEAAALSFLGMGAQPPAAEWGQMLSESFQHFQSAPFLVFYPGLCIMIVVLGFNLLGDGLRDALDPRLNKL